jgi:predicted GTPase
MQGINVMTDDLFTVLFFGKTGAGKSSTLNALFNFNLSVGHAEACTKVPSVQCLAKSQLDLFQHEQIRVIDMPGIAESIEADKVYLPFYEEWIPKVHSLVWVTQADTRAYKQDEIFLSKLIPLFQPNLNFTVALNKIDYLGVDENAIGFDKELKQPSQAQLKEIPIKVSDVYGIFKNVIKDTIIFEQDQIVPYSSFYQWGLDSLKSLMLMRR